MADYYIDGVGGNDITGDGSQGNPWQTLEMCNGLSANDTVFITPGTYTYPTAVPAANLHYVCTEENTENKVILDQAGQTSFLNSPNEINGFYLRNTGAAGKARIQFGNYEVSKGVSDYGHLVLKNCIIGGINTTAAFSARDAFEFQGAVGNTVLRIENCIIFTNADGCEEYGFSKRLNGVRFINVTWASVDKTGGPEYIGGRNIGTVALTTYQCKNCFYAIYENTSDIPDIVWAGYRLSVSNTNYDSDYNYWYGRGRAANGWNYTGITPDNLAQLQAITTADMLTVTGKDDNSYEVARNGTSDADYWAADPIRFFNLNTASALLTQFDQNDPASIITAFTPTSEDSPLVNTGDGINSAHIGFVGPGHPSAGGSSDTFNNGIQSSVMGIPLKIGGFSG